MESIDSESYVMMKNYKIEIQYKGTRYQGWQKQESSSNTIQGKLEDILSKMCGEKISVHGSGRTDAGVHAYAQIANFHCDTLMPKEQIMEYMNRYLPEDIAVRRIEEMHDRFHSRLNAAAKSYHYRIHNSNIADVFTREYTWQVPDDLDIEKMRKATEYLCGTHDFKAFTSARKGNKSTVRTITSIQIEKNGDEICMTYNGNGFLYHMIRILTGTLVEVGKGVIEPAEVIRICDSKQRDQAGPLAPAHGLALLHVLYK